MQQCLRLAHWAAIKMSTSHWKWRIFLHHIHLKIANYKARWCLNVFQDIVVKSCKVVWRVTESWSYGGRLKLRHMLSTAVVQEQEYSLSRVAFRSGMEGGELHAVEVLGTHLIQHLLEGVELTVRSVHIVLIHLPATEQTNIGYIIVVWESNVFN